MSAPDSWANLQGGRYLAELYQKDSIQAAFLQKIITAINTVGANTGTNPVGLYPPPPPIDNVNVQTAGEMMQVTLNHNHPVTRAINYFVEVDTDPNFTQPLVQQLGSSRSSTPFPLPTKNAAGNDYAYYVRAYAQYPGSKPSTPTVFGGPLAPAAIKMGGGTEMALLPSTGSGTASQTGQQGASGFGKAISSTPVVGPIQASVGSTTPQEDQQASGIVGSLDMPSNTFSVSGADPITALPSGGAIDVSFIAQDLNTFLAGPFEPSGSEISGVDSSTTADSATVTNDFTIDLTPSGKLNEWMIVLISGITSVSGSPTITPPSGFTAWTSGSDANGQFFSYYDTTVGEEVGGSFSFSPDAAFSACASLFFADSGVPTVVQEVYEHPIPNHVAFTDPNTEGNGILVLVGYIGVSETWTPTSPEVYDTNNNRYFNLATETTSGTGLYTHCSIWWAPAIVGGDNTVYVEGAGQSGQGAFVAQEISGATLYSALPTWRFIQNWDLQYAIFGGAGADAAPGAVPIPPDTAGTTLFLNENATWMTAVTSVGLSVSVPSYMTESVSDSPITTSGTIELTLGFGSESENLAFMSPNGSSGDPGFRSIVNADLPTSGVTAGSYVNTDITVNAQGIITAASNGVIIGGASLKSGNYDALSTDNGKLLSFNTSTGAWSFVQANQNSSGSAIDFTNNVTEGNLLIVQFGSETISAPSVSNTGSAGAQTWHQIGSTENRGDSGYFNAVFYAIASGSGACDITISGNTGSFPGITVMELGTEDATITLDQVAQSNSGATDKSSYTQDVTSTDSGEAAIFSFLASGTDSGVDSPLTWSTPGTASGGILAYILNTSAGTVAGTGTSNGASPMSCIAATFILESSGASYTLTLPSTPPSSTWSVFAENIGIGTLEVSPNGLLLDEESGSISVGPGQGVYITTDGTNYYTERGLAAASGSTGYVQFNNGGIFDGSANLFWDNSTHQLSVGTSTGLGQLTSYYGSTPNPGTSISTFAITAQGSYGGGIGLRDGSYDWGIYDLTGVLQFGQSSSNAGLNTCMTLSSTGGMSLGSSGAIGLYYSGNQNVVLSAQGGPNLFINAQNVTNPSHGIATFAIEIEGSFGGGIGLLDGSNTWGIFDLSGTLEIGWSSSGASGGLTEVLTLSQAGTLSLLKGGVVTPQPNGSAIFAMDNNATGTTVASGSTFTPFGASDNFSGLLIVDSLNGGGTAIFMVGNGVGLVGTSGSATSWSTTEGNSGSVNVYQVSGVLTIQNEIGTSGEFRVMGLRTRSL